MTGSATATATNASKAVVRRYLEALLEGDIDRLDFPTLIGEGDTVALEWRVEAKTAAGDDYDNRYCGIFVVRDGRIQEVREYFDSAYAARVLYPG